MPPPVCIPRAVVSITSTRPKLCANLLAVSNRKQIKLTRSQRNTHIHACPWGYRSLERQPLLDLLPPGLRDLCLALPALGDVSVEQVTGRCPGLRALTLQASSRLTQRGLHLLAKAPLLKSLTLQTSPSGVEVLRGCVAGMRRLVVGRCVVVRSVALPGGAETVVLDDCGASSDDEL